MRPRLYGPVLPLDGRAYGLREMTGVIPQFAHRLEPPGV
jgi:hypothetical protein